jgi:hypothetical protein
VEDENAKEAKKFEQLVASSKTPPSLGSAEKCTCLAVTLKILKINVAHNWPDKSTDTLLKCHGKVLRKDNKLPETTYKAKKVVCPHALDILKYHACPNDCIIYYKEQKDLQKCPHCDTSRYKGTIIEGEL